MFADDPDLLSFLLLQAMAIAAITIAEKINFFMLEVVVYPKLEKSCVKS